MIDFQNIVIDPENLPATIGGDQTLSLPDAVAGKMEEMAGLIGSLAEMLRVTNERMAAMEAAMRSLEKVTPAQASNINKCIRERAAEICESYRMGVKITPVEEGHGSRPEAARFEANPEKAKKLIAAIRKDVSVMTGARTMREVARCDYGTVIDFIVDWDDYEAVQKIRRAAGQLIRDEEVRI